MRIGNQRNDIFLKKLRHSWKQKTIKLILFIYVILFSSISDIVYLLQPSLSGILSMPNIITQDDQSALYLVVRYNRIELAKILLDAHAKVDLQDKINRNTRTHFSDTLYPRSIYVQWGHTALYMAVYFSRKELAELLLKAGADVDFKDKDGETPLMIAESRDDIEMIALLTKYKKNILAPEKVIWDRSRIMIVGEGRAGKTSFYKCMKGESAQNSNIESTCGLEESAVRFCDIDGKKKEISLSSLTNDDKVNFLDIAATKQIKRDIKERKKLKNADEIAVVEPKPDMNIEVFLTSLPTKKDDKQTNLNEQKRLKDMNMKKESTSLNPITPKPQIIQIDSYPKPIIEPEENPKLNINAPVEEENGSPIKFLGDISHKDLDISVIDYGGQNIFHGFHQLFLIPYGVYCILFNMEKFLLDENSTLYHIRYWFNSIILHASSSENVKNKSIQVPIIIVGSHRDKLVERSNIIKISNSIKTAFKNSYGYENIIQCSSNTNKYIHDFIIYGEDCSEDNIAEGDVVEMKSEKEENVKYHDFFFFPVNNYKINKSDNIFQHMMITIFETITNSMSVTNKINSDFFKVLQQIDEKYKDEKMDTEENIINFLKKLNSSEKIPEKLNFFIDKGLYLKFDKYIIFNVDTFLIRSITKVIYDSRFHNKESSSKYQYDMESQILLKSGVVSKTFIHKLIKEDGKNCVKDTQFIIDFMLHNKLIIPINESAEDKVERYVIPSMLPASKLSYKELLPTSALFFIKTQSENNEHFDPNLLFLSDNFFYQLMFKLIDLSKKISAFGTGQDNFIFKDLIMIRLGAHIIILKSFPEANCVMLHALNKTILSNFIIILSYFIENDITPRISYDVVVDHKIFRSFTYKQEIRSPINADHNSIKDSAVLILCPKDTEDFTFFPLIIVLLCDYNCIPNVVFYNKTNEIEWSEIDSQLFVSLLIFIKKDEDKEQLADRDNKNITIVNLNVKNDDFKTLQNKLSADVNLKNLGESLTMGGSINCNNTIRLFKNILYTGNSVQRFYNAASRIYYCWESNSHDDDQILYFKVSVIPSETKLFFKSIISLNGIAYVFQQLPEIVSLCASPAIFLSDIFVDLLMSLEPTRSGGDKQVVDYLNVQKSYKILECLVLLSSTITKTIFIKPLESTELELKHKKIKSMIERLLKSKSMGNEEKIISALLGKNICPLIKSNENNDVMLRKLRGMVFTDSIVMKCISEKENQTYMYVLTGSWQVSTVIDKAFWYSANINAQVENDLHRRMFTNCSTLSSNPSLLLFLDFIFSIINIILVVLFSYSKKASDFGDFLFLLLSSIVLGVCLRELGELNCVFSEIYQSKSNSSNIIVVAYRTLYVYFGDFWNFFDVIGLLSLLSWLILQYIYSSPYSSTVEMMLSITLKLSPIPLSIGLLRYFVVLKDIGQFILIIFSMTYDLWRFGLIYVIVLLGFGISLNALFNEYSDFSNYFNLFLSMFQMSLNVFEYDTFQVSDEYRHVGQAIMVIMALSVSIILVNAIIAKFGITFREINENVLGVWAMNKARYISRYLQNKNPALMLPPPLNIFIFVIYFVLRFCAWICNITIFMIPDKQVHSWWYAHADLVKDFSIGICSSISSAVVSLILLPFFAVFEPSAFMQFLSKSKKYIRNFANVNKCYILMESWMFSKQTSEKFMLHDHIMLLVLSFLLHLYSVLFLTVRAVLLFLFWCIVIISLFCLWIIYLFFIVFDIFKMLYKNMTFLYYQFVISSFFLTKEGRDIWDIQGPSVLEKIIQLKSPDKSSNLLRKRSLSRIKWFYNNFFPAQSLRLIYEESESDVGEKFLIQMIEELRKGADREKMNIYDTLPPPVVAIANAEDMLLTHKEIKRLFEIESDEDENIQCQLKKIQNSLDNKIQKIQKQIDHKFEKQSEHILSIINNRKTDFFSCINSENRSDKAAANLPYNKLHDKVNGLPPGDPLSIKGEAYMNYFEDAMKTTKIDEGTYVSKFSLGDN